MKQSLVLGGILVLLGGSAVAQVPGNAPVALATQRAVLDKYCVTCHNDKLRTGGLSLQGADLSNLPKNAEVWEKVIRKVRAGAMPPQGMPRPDAAGLDRFASFLLTSMILRIFLIWLSSCARNLARFTAW